MSMRKAINEHYEVSQCGRVFSISRCVRFVDKAGNERFRRLKGREISQHPDSAGYQMVIIGKKRTRVHRLVADAFVINPEPNAYPVVKHLDNNRANNHYKNLKWDTQKQNVIDAFNDGLHKPFTKITQRQLDEAVRLMASGLSQTRAANQTGISQAYLSVLLSGKYKRTRSKPLDAQKTLEGGGL